MDKIKEVMLIFLLVISLVQSVSAISNVQHSVDGNKVTLTYQGTPPFWINMRGDTNIGQAGGYLWAKTYSKSFSYDISFAINPSKKFYYGVKDISWSPLNSFTLQECGEGFVLDEETNICMEQLVYNKINDIRTRAKICDDCNNLPQPTISLDNGNQNSIYNVFLNNKKVTKFPLPFFTVQSEIIENPQNVLIETYRIESGGTNSIKFLIPAEGNYFQNRYDILVPDQETNINYQIIKKQGQYGSAYFFILEDDDTFDLNSIIQNFDNIVRDHSNLANLETIDPYYVIAMPSIFALLLGGEGTFYMGNHLITMNFGGEKYYELYNQNIFNNEQAHEYVHGLQETIGLWQKYQNAAFFMEGMADTVAIYNGYRNWENIGPFGGDIDPGCSYLPNPNVPHTLGRCIFKHLDQNGFLNNAFFNRLFHPTENYDLIGCEISLQNTECANQLNRLLSYLTNQDMTSFMREELLANI